MVSASTRPGRIIWTTVCVLFANGVTVGTDVLTATSLCDNSPEFDVSDGPVAVLALLDRRASSSTVRLGVPSSVGCVPLLVSILIISTVVGFVRVSSVFSYVVVVDEKNGSYLSSFTGKEWSAAHVHYFLVVTYLT